jgi:leucyl aminopeptidase (aminopeptidase T)
MSDARYQRLAETITRHSCRVAGGEKVLIEAFDIPAEFTAVLVRAIAAAGGLPICLTKQNRVLRELYRNATEAQMRFWGEIERKQMEGVRPTSAFAAPTTRPRLPRSREMDLPEALSIRHTEVRVPAPRVVMRWPIASMAQQARMTPGVRGVLLRGLHRRLPGDGEGDGSAHVRMERTKRVMIRGPARTCASQQGIR